MDQDDINQQHPMPGKRAQFGYLLLAYIMVALGVAGAILPLLPATPFLLVAVWAAPKGSQKVHDWIYAQPRFARLINDWHDEGAVPLSAKWLATIMMIISWSSLIWMQSHWGLVLGMSLFFMCVAIFLWTRPNPRAEARE